MQGHVQGDSPFLSLLPGDIFPLVVQGGTVLAGGAVSVSVRELKRQSAEFRVAEVASICVRGH